MPCTVSEAEERYYEEQHNKKAYGVEWTDAKLTTAVACWLAKNVPTNTLDDAPAYVNGWIEQHRREDKE